MTEEILLPGKEGRQYRIISKQPIDHGSTSQLFLGEQVTPEEQAGRKVAIKVGLSSDEKPTFEKEVEVLALLWDIAPGTVPELYDVDLKPRRPYLIMEYLASAQSLADLVQGNSEGYLSEKEAAYWATRYGEILGSLHDVDFAAPDRKLGDLLLVKQPSSTAGNDQETSGQTGDHELRLVVVDWGGVASLTPQLAQFDLLLFTQFWYRLLLGSHSFPDVSLGTRRPEHHRRWQELSYGARRILSRGLSQVTQQRYGEIGELLGNWRELETLWSQPPEKLEQAFKKARQDRAYAKALRCLDIIRLVDRPRWQSHEHEIEPLLNELDTANVLIKRIQVAIRRGESLADANVKEPLKRGVEQYGDDPGWQLRAHRWQVLAEFSGSLSAEAHKVFRDEVVDAWIRAIEAMEEENWDEALDQFWDPINHLLSPNQENPQAEATMNQARKLLHMGKRIEAQERINAIIDETPTLRTTGDGAIVNLLNNAFFPKHCRLGGILALLIESELRNNMLNLATSLSLGRKEEIYASSNAVGMLQNQLSYAPLLKQAGVIWLDEWQKSLDQQLDLCAKADEVLAESVELSNRGKFREAGWALEAIYRQFEFSQPLESDSTGTLISKVNSIAEAKRYELQGALKEVENLAQIFQLLEQPADTDEFSETRTIPQADNIVPDLSQSKPHAPELIDQVNRILRNGPVLISLEPALEDRQESTPGGDTA
jgi:serine/threonine protein kinase